jgi:small nuclear ribonucleoprotein (snRNP)-like protein
MKIDEDYLKAKIGQEVRIKCHNNEYYKGILLSSMGDYLRIELGKNVETYIYKNNILQIGDEVKPTEGFYWSQGVM